MPATPDKLDTIIALLLDVKQTVAGRANAPDEAHQFVARWAPVSREDAAKTYGVAWPAKIPAMAAYDEAEAIYRARAGYSTQGYATSESAWKSAPSSVGIIAHATQETASQLYECGYGTCDPDVAAYGFFTGVFKSKAEFTASLGSGVQPRDYAGVTLAGMLAPNFTGGGPGVG